MTTIYINLGSTGSNVVPPWDDNNFGTTASTTVGVISSDLLDDTSSSTGIGFENITAFNGASGSIGAATVDSGGWPHQTFDFFWYFNGTGGTQRLTGLTNGDTYVIEAAGHQSNAARDTNFTIGGTTTLYDSSGTTTPNPPISFSGTISGTTLDIDPALVSTFGYVNGFKIIITAAASGPTVTGPTTITDGVAVQFTGTDLDTATTAGFQSGTDIVTNTIDAQTATTLDITPDLGTPTSSTPVASMPVTPDVTAAGITPYVLESWADDGSNKGTFTLTTLSAGANTTTCQGMIATSNTTEGESLLAASILPTMEDDYQWTGPSTQSGVTITYNADGTVSTSPANQITVDIIGFSPATGQRSLARVTITGTVIGAGLSIKSVIKKSVRRSILG